VTVAPRLRAVPTPFAAEFGKNGALRTAVGDAGRVHLDRWLPFLVVHRGDADAAGLARRIAVDSSSYLVWGPDDDLAALSALELVCTEVIRQFGRLLIITLDDLPLELPEEGSQDLPRFVARIGAGDRGDVGRAAAALEDALHDIEIDLRRCKSERVPFAPILPTPFDQLLNTMEGVHRLSLHVPQIHRRPGGGDYPAISHELAVATGDALLRAACAFLDNGQTPAPPHYRALGRSAYLAAALKADRQLDKISRSFDFLLSISPIDSAKAYRRFVAAGEQEAPRFHYRPLTVDPDSAKRRLYAIDFRAIEDPLLERLLGEKRHELDAQLTMLATRNTAAFRPASMFLYGMVDQPLLDEAQAILASTARDPPRGATVRASEIALAAQALAERYRAVDGAFVPTIEVREDIAGLLVSGSKLLIGADTIMPASRLEALLAHEVSVHLLTWFNGAGQGLTIFRTGLAGYEGIQEGLGVFAEWAVGGLTRTRLRLLAGRVVAVDAMQRGAGFVDTYRLLAGDHGFSKHGAFGIAARVHRSGGLAKDSIYLRGFRAVMAVVADGASLEPFWLGKIADVHAPAIKELLQRGLVHAPRFTPLFLSNPAAQERVAQLRANGLSDIVTGELSGC
jgi:uncharacterized protein (TIGR02421 family)